MDLGQLVKKIPVVGPVFGSVDFKAPEGSGFKYLEHLEGYSDDRRISELSKKVRELREHSQIKGNPDREVELTRAVDDFYEVSVKTGYIDQNFNSSRAAQNPIARWYFKLGRQDYNMFEERMLIDLIQKYTPREPKIRGRLKTGG